jgi:hypothetical protein
MDWGDEESDDEYVSFGGEDAIPICNRASSLSVEISVSALR